MTYVFCNTFLSYVVRERNTTCNCSTVKVNFQIQTRGQIPKTRGHKLLLNVRATRLLQLVVTENIGDVILNSFVSYRTGRRENWP